MLQIRDLQVDKAGQTVCSVPELEIGRGERVAVIGSNGSGKTTLLRVVAGLEREFTGRCQVGAAPRDRVYLHQSPYLFRGSVLLNASYGLAARHVPRRERLATAREWLGTLGVERLVHRKCRHLSGGERKRVALARALAIPADLLLLDEPFTDLDEQGIDLVCRALSAVPRATILIASPMPLPDALSVRSYCLAPGDAARGCR